MIAAFPIIFLGCLLFLLFFATEQNRVPLWIVTISNIVGWILVLSVTRHIAGDWKLVVPAAGETLTILALFGFGRNRTAYFQAVLLLIAWCAHVLCYVDCETGSNIVYDRYEQILAVVAALQLLGFYDTWGHSFRTLQRWYHLWAFGRGVVSDSGARSGVVLPPSKPGQ